MKIGNLGFTKNFWGTTKKALKSYEYLVFDPKYTEELEKGLKTKNVKDAFKSAYHNTAKEVGNTNVFKRIWKNLRGVRSEYGTNIKRLKNIKDAGHKLGFFKKLGVYLKPISKRMPLVANLAAVAFAIPTIIKAFSHGGVGAGIKETGKEGLKLGAFAIGAAIGTALGGPIGAIAGGFIAGWIADKCTGKSFAEKEAEAKAAQAQATATETSFTGNTASNTAVNTATNAMANPDYAKLAAAYSQYSSNPFASNDYMNEDFMKMNAFSNQIATAKK